MEGSQQQLLLRKKAPECPPAASGERLYRGGDTWRLTCFCYQTLYGRGDLNLLLSASTSLTQEKNIMACLQPGILHRQQEPLRGERQRRKTEEMVTSQQRKGAVWPASQELLRTRLLSIIILPGSDTACFPT